MTVYVNIGRRIPRAWYKRQANRAKGLISFQEHIWIMIKQSLSLAKKKANASGKLKFVLTRSSEHEDLNYDLEWLKIVIQGTKEQEEEEYNDSMKMYQQFGSITKKELPKNEQLSKHFKSRILNAAKVQDAYDKGYGAMSDNNISNKLLEMGILTHVEWIKDFNERDIEIKPDF